MQTGLKFPSLPTRRVLLVGSDLSRVSLRVRALGKLGVDVDCAGDISEARKLWQPKFYHLVLIDATGDRLGAALFRHWIKSTNPRQRVAFLVGYPDFVAPEAEQHRTSRPLQSNLTVPQEPLSVLSSGKSAGMPARSVLLDTVVRMTSGKSLYSSARNVAAATIRSGATDSVKIG